MPLLIHAMTQSCDSGAVQKNHADTGRELQMKLTSNISMGSVGTGSPKLGKEQAGFWVLVSTVASNFCSWLET